MISVMNTNDFELDRKSDPIKAEPRAKPRVSALDSSAEGTEGGGGKSVHSAVSEGVLRGDFVDAADGGKVRASVDPSERDMSVVDNRVSGDVRASNLDRERESRVSGSSDNGFSGRNVGAKRLGHEIVVKNGKADSVGSKGVKGCIEVGKSYDSMLSMFDEFAAGGDVGGVSVRSPKPVDYGYEIGDMVWGKVKSHPWWPGQIYNEEFASPSVRRSKREGHVLVAFFGDSSYGWFDPAELIPFDSNYEEKSRQISSKPFMKAVEEAVDELSRRRGMGLECRCRNAYNFRPTDIEGYFAVDVGDYDPGAVYSTTQIKKARDSFQPREALDFIKQVALAPRSVEHSSIDFIKNKATVLAYRKAVFEEYDETYAQAFGYEPVRPTPKPPQENAPGTIAARAPLSGRLVIAESLGKGKSSGKPSKVKEHVKKDKYLFKRRDEPKEVKVRPKKEGRQSSSLQPIFIEGSSATAAGEYVLQKRAPEVSAKPEQTGTLPDFEDLAGKDVKIDEKPTASAHSNIGVQITASKIESPASSSGGEAPPGYSNRDVEMNSSADMGKGVKLILGSDVALGSRKMADSVAVEDKLHTVEPAETKVSLKDGIQSSGANKAVEGFEMAPSRLATTELHGGNLVKDGRSESGPKKVKVRKRPAGELSSDKTVVVEKKKRKKDLMSSDIPRMRVKDAGSVVRKDVARPLQVGVPLKETNQADHQSTDVRTGSSDTIRVGDTELEVPQILSYLYTLALDPFYGSDRGIPAMVAQVFLRYRSLVYQKSLALSQLAGDDANEARPSKSPAVGAASDYPSSKDVGEVPRKRPPQPRPSVRPDDPTKGGRKRGPSDRQEEIAVKKKKKVSDIRNLTVEKKVGQKTPEAARAESRQPVASVPRKVGQESTKRMEQPPPSRASVPTMLVMKFPPGANIPSVNELKAKFIRFGPDKSLIRSFWKTSTCRVVFKDRKNADEAYQFFKSSRIFGEAKGYLRDVTVAGSEADYVKVEKEDASTGLQTAGVPRPSPVMTPGMQLKSILKKAGGEEAAGVGNGGGRGTRVKFKLGEEESNRGGGEQTLMIGNKNNFNNNASFADGGASSSTTSHATMDFNSKNFQKVNFPPHMLSPPILPLPIPVPTTSTSSSHAQSSRPQNTMHYSTEPVVTPQLQQLPLPPPPPSPPPPRNAPHNYNMPVYVPPPPPPAPAPAPNVDIGPQMLSLLNQCNDVVSNIKNWLGYEPWHPF